MQSKTADFIHVYYEYMVFYHRAKFVWNRCSSFSCYAILCPLRNTYDLW